jgi:hypothetical protein
MSSDEGGTGTTRSDSRVSRFRNREQSGSTGQSWSDHDEHRGMTSRPVVVSRSHRDPSPSRFSFSLSLNQATPARSYFQRSFHGSQGKEKPLEPGSPHRSYINSSDGHHADVFSGREGRHRRACVICLIRRDLHPQSLTFPAACLIRGECISSGQWVIFRGTC